MSETDVAGSSPEQTDTDQKTPPNALERECRHQESTSLWGWGLPKRSEMLETNMSKTVIQPRKMERTNTKSLSLR